MSTFEVLRRFGTGALLRFTAGLVLFVALHVLRLPLLLVARVLEASMCRVDAYMTGLVSDHAPPMGREQWIEDEEEEVISHVYAA